MGTNKSNCIISVAILRILDEYSDERHRLSVETIRGYLSEIYGIETSGDTVRKNIDALLSFFEQTSPDAEHRTPCLFPDAELDFTKSRSAADDAGVCLRARPFADAEVDFLADAVCSAPFANTDKGGDVLERITSLASPTARARLHTAHTRERGAVNDPKQGLDVFSSSLIDIREAIERHWTISFDYARYVPRKTRNVGSTEVYEMRAAVTGRQSGSHFSHTSPYLLRYMNGHYFLLANGKRKSAHEDRFRTFRVDLMRNVRICLYEELEPGAPLPETDERYLELASQDAPYAYFRTAIDGFGSDQLDAAGTRPLIHIRCHESALHYVAERFIGFPQFRVTRPADCDEGMYDVRFEGSDTGFAYWAQKFVDTIEILEPAHARRAVMKRLRDNAYGLELADASDAGSGSGE